MSNETIQELIERVNFEIKAGLHEGVGTDEAWEEKLNSRPDLREKKVKDAIKFIREVRNVK